MNIEGYFKPELKSFEDKKLPLQNTFNVSYVAYTVLLKGLHYLLEAWENIMKEPGKENLHLYVGGRIDKSVMGYIQEHFKDLKNVHYEGNISNISAFLSDKQLFVVPSLTEGSPITALESAQCGVPVILTRNCGVRKFFEDGSGWVIPIRDIEKIKENILWAYNNPEETKQKGLDAKKKLDNYEVESLMRALADHIEQN